MGKSKNKAYQKQKNRNKLKAAPVNPSTKKIASPESAYGQSSSSSSLNCTSVQPEQMSLEAYRHVRNCLNGETALPKEAVNCILRLSQHLRVFGLLSAVGYLNQAKDGTVQDWVKPMWTRLLWQLVFDNALIEPSAEDRKILMQQVQKMANENAPVYMATWRKALLMSNHWNFWAKANQVEDNHGSTENRDTTD